MPVPYAGAGDRVKIDDTLEDIQESIDKGRFSELLTGGLTALLPIRSIKKLG